ncbi:MAG: alpha/beta hydrolase [Anaerolineales bacterium]|nr:alpha/beta hydrolase [Anaerolineales bacterium]
MTEGKKSKGCLGTLLWGIGVMSLVAILSLAILFINQRIALSRLHQGYSPPGKLVAVNSHFMHIHYVGSGSPTVVINAGNGSFSLEWMPIQEQLSQSMRVCTYDRAGYSWSEPGPGPRHGVQVIDELRALLTAAGESAPYILVGHPLGGVHIRIFALQYPHEVAGLVLIDTASRLTITSDYEQRIADSIGFYRVMNLLTRSGILRILGPLGGESSMPETARTLRLELQETYLNLLLNPNQYATAIAEMEQLPRTFQQASQLMVGERPLNDLPLIVLTAGQMAAPGSTPLGEQHMPVNDIHIEQQEELAQLSSQGEQRLIPESGHLVHLDEPAAVLQAILDVYDLSE